MDDMSGVVHSLVSRGANMNDVTRVHHLLESEEKRAFGDLRNQGVGKRPGHQDSHIGWHIAFGRISDAR